MTLNTAHFRFSSVDIVANLINQHKPHLLALQEIDVKTRRSNSVDQAQDISAKTGMKFDFTSAFDYDNGKYGIANLQSICDKSLAKSIKLPSNDEQRVMQLQIIPLDPDTDIIFLNSHLEEKNHDIKMKQIDTIENFTINLTNDLKKNFVAFWAGDFNTIPEELAQHNFIRTKWKNVQCNNEIQKTFPVKPKAVSTLDYILYFDGSQLINRSKIKLISCEVLKEPVVSDHLAMVAKFVINKEH